MRIVGGALKGRALTAPKHDGLRPTSDRVRESVFNILEHGVDAAGLRSGRVIDLFSGTGALGLEALSRGADFALFVDDAAQARALIRQNIEAFGLTGVSKIFRRSATDLGPVGTMQPFDLAFLDPPYNKGLGEQALECLASGGWLHDGAVVVLEESSKAEIAKVEGFAVVDQRQYGDTVTRFLTFKRASSAP
jgi:16S rRNA (guanine966-N2)-methyltransferase